MNGYDFVVVGGGTAGCVLAARLSDDPGARVLMLEAGEPQPLPESTIPSAWPAIEGTRMDWADKSVVQAASGRAESVPRGRGLGGSSAINAMVFLRGHRSSYDAWAGAGAQGWGFDDLLPYFRRSERVTGRNPALRGVAGPLAPSPVPKPHPLAVATMDAAAEAGHPIMADIVSGVSEGFGWPDVTIVDGRRQSAADAYLAPIADRPNLHIVTGARANRLLVAGGRCRGVEFQVGSEVRTAYAEETVVAAGAVGSPQLLLVSGIGPAAQLRDLGIEVASHVPGVGANLHDHPTSGVSYRAARPIPPSTGNHVEALGLLRSSAEAARPDLQIFLVTLGGAESPLVPGHSYSLAVSAMAPHSRGTLRLASASPNTPPVIDPGYYSDPRDVDTVVAGLRAAREIGRAQAFRGWCDQEVMPGRGALSVDQLRSYVRASTHGYHHYVGTCRLGTDDAAVVDVDLRVRGVAGLRVADASVMPSIVSANTMATVYAIAERAAELMRTNVSRSG